MARIQGTAGADPAVFLIFFSCCIAQMPESDCPRSDIWTERSEGNGARGLSLSGISVRKKGLPIAMAVLHVSYCSALDRSVFHLL